MEKKIEDYLHLYLGCECMMRLIGLEEDHQIVLTAFMLTSDAKVVTYKPILRPLSDMTEEEMGELARIICPKLTSYMVQVLVTDAIHVQTHGDGKTTQVDNWTPDMILWALSKSFDLFHLIESGLAINKLTVN